jgi:zinc/manganese transport system substrate-binding protein
MLLRILMLLSLVTIACGTRSAGGGSAVDTSLISVIAAENFYGDIAHQIGGDRVRVTSILNDPNADPHEYESSADNAKAVATASLVIVNGAGYDSFMDKLLAASPKSNRTVIDVANAVGVREGDNPHVWYNVDWMARTADAITMALGQASPADAPGFA